jgi:integrase
MRYTACRLNEAGGLIKQNVHNDKNYIVLATVLGKDGKLRSSIKTKRVRPLPFIPETKKCLDSKSPSEFVFTQNGKPYRTKTLERIWDKANKLAVKKYGTSRINLSNGLKHSFGMQKLAEGFSMDQIQPVMGHTTTKTTQRYAQHQTSKLVNVMRRMRSPNIQHSLIKITIRNKKMKWLGDEESNLDSRSQSPASYH